MLKAQFEIHPPRIDPFIMHNDQFLSRIFPTSVKFLVGVQPEIKEHPVEQQRMSNLLTAPLTLDLPVLNSNNKLLCHISEI